MPSELDQVVARCETILAQCLIAANQAAAAAASIGTAGLAPLESPAFTGAPTAPTPPDGDASNRISTTAFLGSKLGQPSGIATLDVSGLIPISQLPLSGLTYDGTWDADTNTPTLASSSGTVGHFFVVTVSGTTNLNGITNWNAGDWALFGSGVWTNIPYVAPPISNLPLSSLEGIAPNTMVANTMAGTASPTAISIASITSLLSTAIGDSGGGGVKGLVPAPPPGSAGSGAFLRADMTYVAPSAPDLSAYALLNSPAFMGTATVPTIARDTISSAVANTQFVISQLAGSDEVGLIGVNGTASAGTSTHGARIDHVHATDLSRAGLNSPAFIGVGSWTGTLTITSLIASALSGTMTGARTLSGTTTILGTLNGTVVGESNLLLVDGTIGNATTGRHGLLPKLSGNAAQVLSGTGGFVALASGLVSIQTITTTGTGAITIPAGATKLKAILVGGGAGKGIGAPDAGGGGATLFKFLSGLTPGNTLNGSVGAGGTTAPTNGGNTVLSSGSETITTLTAGGGQTDGSGGVATNGDLNVPGGNGRNDDLSVFMGGNSLFSTNGPSGASGSNGKLYGGGGVAGTASNATGAQGCMILEWYA